MRPQGGCCSLVLELRIAILLWLVVVGVKTWLMLDECSLSQVKAHGRTDMFMHLDRNRRRLFSDFERPATVVLDLYCLSKVNMPTHQGT